MFVMYCLQAAVATAAARACSKRAEVGALGTETPVVWAAAVILGRAATPPEAPEEAS